MAEFTSKEDKLYIDGKEVLRGWESFSGCYWFATEKVDTQDSYMGKLPDGTDDVAKDDTIFYGFVQMQEEEWGNFSLAELERMGKYKVWEIPKKNLSYSGRRD